MKIADKSKSNFNVSGKAKRKFTCACCKSSMPVRFGRVFNQAKGKKLEACDECYKFAYDVVGTCANCDDSMKKGLMLISSNALLNKEFVMMCICSTCEASAQGINDCQPNSDSESVF